MDTEEQFPELAEQGILELDGFVSDDGKHRVVWDKIEDSVSPVEYEGWWCSDHNKLYYGGCI